MLAYRAIVFVIVLSISLSVPTIDAGKASFYFEAVIVDEGVILLNATVSDGIRHTAVGNITIERHDFEYRIIANATLEGTRLVKVDVQYKKYEIRQMGDDWDIIFYCDGFYAFFSVKSKISFNGTHISFYAGSFEAYAGVYEAGDPNYVLIAIAIALIIIAVTRKLFPNKLS